MPSPLPFQPVITSVGLSVTIAAVSNANTNATITSKNANSILVTNTGTVTLFVRMSAEASPVASTLDIPMPAGAQRVFSNPVPFGTTGIAAIGTGLGNGNVIFTPGNQGE